MPRPYRAASRDHDRLPTQSHNPPNLQVVQGGVCLQGRDEFRELIHGEIDYAGFSGGRKSVLPGIAAEKTIEFNHRPEMLLAPAARPGQMDGNPIHLDMMEAADLLKIHFMVNLVLNQGGETVGISQVIRTRPILPRSGS